MSAPLPIRRDAGAPDFERDDSAVRRETFAPARGGLSEVPRTRYLEAISERFARLEARPADLLHHRVLQGIHEICAVLLECEREGYSRAELLDAIRPARDVHRRSSFIRRLQDWPRGYPGDFETIERLCEGTSDVPGASLEAICEEYVLRCPAAQQHRNKIARQAALMRSAVQKHGAETRILSVASGGSRDLRSIDPREIASGAEIVLNDNDPEALRFAADHLGERASACSFRAGNIFRVARQLEPARFHLVIGGGLFDYLDERAAVTLLRLLRRLLAEDGELFFTNMARGNPYRPWMTYFGEWHLIERDEEEIRRICKAAGFSRESVTCGRDETGLALLVTARKTAAPAATTGSIPFARD